MIKAVIFDFGQTLADSSDGFRTAEKDAQIKLFSDIGKINQKEFLTNYRRLRKEFHDRSNFSRNSLWLEVYRYYGVKPRPETVEKWESVYWETVKSYTALFPEAEDVLQSLSDRYIIALITNTQGQKTADTHRISLYPELEKFFKVIVVAGEGGIPPKPDPKPFRICLEELDIEAAEAIYVGDDWRIDICGARDAGLHPIWIKHHRVRRNWPRVTDSVPVIKSLVELLDLEKLF